MSPSHSVLHQMILSMYGLHVPGIFDMKVVGPEEHTQK